MSKAGTKSISKALKELGYDVWDSMDIYQNFCDSYLKFLEEGWNLKELQEIYENIEATVGGPSYYFWDDLIEAFPKAKVILTERDSDEIWYRSMEKQLKLLYSTPFYLYNFTSPLWRHFWRFSTDLVLLPFGLERRKPFDTDIQVAETVWKQAYRRHNAYVKNACPEDRLLVFNLKEGWEPLCEFLGKPVPAIPFPHENKTGQFFMNLWNFGVFKHVKKEGRSNVCLFGLFTLTAATLYRFCS